jgi:hypothetical protein
MTVTGRRSPLADSWWGGTGPGLEAAFCSPGPIGFSSLTAHPRGRFAARPPERIDGGASTLWQSFVGSIAKESFYADAR